MSLQANRLLQYEHVGRTALVDDDAAAQGGRRLWVQGESDGGAPAAGALAPRAGGAEAEAEAGAGAREGGVEDVLPFAKDAAAAAPSLRALAGASDYLGGLAARIRAGGSASESLVAAGGDLIDGLGKQLLQRTGTDAAAPLEQLAQTLAAVPAAAAAAFNASVPATPVSLLAGVFGEPQQVIVRAMAASGLDDEGLAELLAAGGEALAALGGLGSAAADLSRGLDPAFVDRERRLLGSLLDGTALEHHLEPSYFTALRTAVDEARSEVNGTGTGGRGDDAASSG